MASNYYYPVQHSRSKYPSYGHHHAAYPPSHQVMSYQHAPHTNMSRQYNSPPHGFDGTRHHAMSHQHAPHANMSRQYNLPPYGFDATRHHVQQTRNVFMNDSRNIDSKKRRRGKNKNTVLVTHSHHSSFGR